jgi:hypothetical protein
LRELAVFKHDIAALDLSELLTVDCTMDNILLYGRYCKYSREVSQTPWLIGTKRMVIVYDLTFDKAISPRTYLRQHASHIWILSGLPARCCKMTRRLTRREEKISMLECWAKDALLSWSLSTQKKASHARRASMMTTCARLSTAILFSAISSR